MSKLTQEVQWHGIDEPRPKSGFYLVCLNGHVLPSTLVWSDDKCWKWNTSSGLEKISDDFNITHWMPLPKSPIHDEADAEG